MLSKEETLKLILQPHYHVVLNNATSLTQDQATEIKKTITRVYPYYQGACEYIDSLVAGTTVKIRYFAFKTEQITAPLADISSYKPFGTSSVIVYKEVTVPSTVLYWTTEYCNTYLKPTIAEGTTSPDEYYFSSVTDYETAVESIMGSKSLFNIDLYLDNDSHYSSWPEEYKSALEDYQENHTFVESDNYSILFEVQTGEVTRENKIGIYDSIISNASIKLNFAEPEIELTYTDSLKKYNPIEQLETPYIQTTYSCYLPFTYNEENYVLGAKNILTNSKIYNTSGTYLGTSSVYTGDNLTDDSKPTIYVSIMDMLSEVTELKEYNFIEPYADGYKIVASLGDRLGETDGIYWLKPNTEGIYEFTELKHKDTKINIIEI